jgi:hypothetical protein
MGRMKKGAVARGIRSSVDGYLEEWVRQAGRPVG